MLIDFFREVKNHALMTGIMQEYGGPIDEKAIHSYPHIVWIPTQDTYIYPQYFKTEELINLSPLNELSNEPYFAQIAWSRSCGCSLYMFEREYEKMEELINLVHNVIYDVANSKANLRIDGNPGTGKWKPREQLSENTVCYVQDITVLVPVYKFNPTGVPITSVINYNANT